MISACRKAAMADPVARSILDAEPDEALAARLDAQAEADFAAGRVVPHAEVVAWLKSWETADELPCPSPKTP
jgi:predicted transcriptional regulator